MRGETDRVIALQEDIGLDVLVRGRRSATTCAVLRRGTLRVHGHRAGLGPVVWKPVCPAANPAWDVHRPAPMTVDCVRYAQSRTDKQMKGMLTGPVTMLAWSFVRDGLAAG